MTLPQHNNPRSNREAKAPYNFVPLPEHTLWAGDLPEMDVYHLEQHTGWLDCVLTTASPLYVRCGLRPKQVGEMQAKDQPDFFYTDPRTKEPVIPGSSLRGMLRAMVEIVSYSKVQPVSDAAKMSFRAVAAPKDDPLTQPYQNVLGKYGRNVKTGYLKKQGQQWMVEPARKPSDSGMAERGYYLKVKDKYIPAGAVSGLIKFRQSDYKPQYHNVSFDTERRNGKRGPHTAVVNISNRGTSSKYHGVLVCSGNMAESGNDASSKRKNYALVLERALGNRVIPIDKQTVQDYINILTDFQKEPPFDERRGCLVEGRPIFYVERHGKVVAFGHCPNFRVPAWLPGSQPQRAATARDFVPERLRDSNQTDLAEAIFGYVKDSKKATRDVARRGRICVTDAALEPGQGDIRFDPANPIVTPNNLSSPKPTTFQHYLVQTHPNNKRDLHHYGSTPKDETVIRGHKLYWHKKDDVQRRDFEEPDRSKWEDSQHTKIKPVRSGVSFQFRIHFENLDHVELGALLWLMDVAGDDDYRLKLGMGKPLGLGAVKVESTLHLTDRRERYTHLFDKTGWATGEQTDADTIWQSTVGAFEQRILQDRVLNSGRATSLRDVSRIQMLLFLLSWPGPDGAKTRYLQIEHGPSKENEYSERPVLPTPKGVLATEKGERPKVRQSRPQRPASGPRDDRSGRRTGRVKWFSEQKGYGFIAVDGGEDVFVHYSNIQDTGFRTLHEGQWLEFSIEQTSKGPQAKNVHLSVNKKDHTDVHRDLTHSGVQEPA